MQDEFYRNYLQHHGILGQKWGKQNGPPYPLGVSDHSAREKKMGWRKSLDKSSPAKHTKSSRAGKTSKSDAREHKGLTDKQKRAIKIGAAFCATALVTYGTYRLAKSGKLDKQIALGKNYLDELLGKKNTTSNFMQQKYSDLFKDNSANPFEGVNFDTLKFNPGGQATTNTKTSAASQFVNGIKKLARPESLEETLRNVNPHRVDDAYSNNCTLCSIASFLRQKGYDVTAGKTGGKQQNLGGMVEKCFKGAKVLDGSAVKFGRSRQDAAEMLVRRFGNNASGVCGVQWKTGGGHAFNWQIKNGVVSFFDGQAGKDDSFVSRVYWKMINSNDSLILARLDNAEVDLDAIKELLE